MYNNKTLIISKKRIKPTIPLKLITLFIFVLVVILTNTIKLNAKVKDTKKPTVSVTANTNKMTNKKVKITFKATDTSGIKTLKWSKGKQKLSYFSKKGTVLKATSKNTVTVSVKENDTYTFYALDKAGNAIIKTIQIKNIDTVAPTVKLSSTVMNQKATVSVSAQDSLSGIKNIKYVKGSVTKLDDEKWTTKAKDITDASKFTIKTKGKYSVLVTDGAGNQTIDRISVVLELNAVWISYLEFSNKGYTKQAFTALIDSMFDNVVKLNMNAVIVQVRPFSDAMYPSKYFPWSTYVSGEQGKDPGYDPLAYMVKAAHDRGLEFHAWLNPYRVTLTASEIYKLSEDNPAKVWLESDNTTSNRNVLKLSSKYYYNPASKEVHNLILGGVKEIITNYDVDGIHFDDYFYPTLGDKYETIFDSLEYSYYVIECIINKTQPITIANWRRENVNTLIRSIYKSIKKYDSSIQFGISPAGNIDTLLSDKGNYVDIKTWLSSSNYIDYIAPQIYWSFQHTVCPFDKTVDRWLSLRTSSTVNLYIGIANYKAGSNDDNEWKTSTDVLKRQVEYGRNTLGVDGFMYFRYDHFFKNTTQKEVQNLIGILK